MMNHYLSASQVKIKEIRVSSILHDKYLTVIDRLI